MKISKEIIKKIELEAKKFFIDSSGCHDWSHIERVKKLALKIGKEEKADLDILEIASLLHDIGRKEEMKKKGIFCHAEKSAEISKRILKKYKFDPVQIENILHSIITHRFRNNHIPCTIEAKVLYDADKLDSIGAIGIGRDFLFAGNAGAKKMYSGDEKQIVREGRAKMYEFSDEDTAILEYEVKLKHIKNKILTQTGKKIAQERHQFMEKFFKQFWLEVAGKK